MFLILDLRMNMQDVPKEFKQILMVDHRYRNKYFFYIETQGQKHYFMHSDESRIQNKSLQVNIT